jgi:3-deoxy-manno-octulosonate cytidylyltransferase (CMP-KDO synthetase)
VAPDFIAIVPARRASTRLPDKPLLDVAGKPLVIRTAMRAQASRARRVVVATDDADILACCEQHGVEVIMTRTDHASGTERLSEAASILQLPEQQIVVNVQGDEPLIEPELIDAVAQALMEADSFAMATACHALTSVDDLFNPNVVKVVRGRNGQALYFSRAPIPWSRDNFDLANKTASGTLEAMRHIGIYGYRSSFLRLFPTLAAAPLEAIEMLEQLRALWHGERIMCIESASMPHAGVDTPEDLERVRRFYQDAQNAV